MDVVAVGLVDSGQHEWRPIAPLHFLANSAYYSHVKVCVGLAVHRVIDVAGVGDFPLDQRVVGAGLKAAGDLGRLSADLLGERCFVVAGNRFSGDEKLQVGRVDDLPESGLSRCLQAVGQVGILQLNSDAARGSDRNGLAEIVGVSFRLVFVESGTRENRVHAVRLHRLVNRAKRTDFLLVGPLEIPESQGLNRLTQLDRQDVDLEVERTGVHLPRANRNAASIRTGCRIFEGFDRQPVLHSTVGCDVGRSDVFQIGRHVHHTDGTVRVEPFFSLPGAGQAAHELNDGCCQTRSGIR